MINEIKKDDSTIFIDNEKYPNLLLRKQKNGQLESIEYSELDREIIVIEILEKIEEVENLQNKKNHMNINL